jgi:transketolase
MHWPKKNWARKVKKEFIKTLTEIAEKDSRIVLLTADLGYLAIETFAEKFPERFFNVGVAEQNLLGLATGLASSGLIPFVYSIVPFAVLRPYEIIRNGPIYHHLPVRIIGIGAGFDYGHNGLTHYGLEDLAVLRPQMEIQIISPADSEQACSALLQTWNLPGPIYYRLGKDEPKPIPGLAGQFKLQQGIRLGTGKDFLVATTGSITALAVEAVEELKKKGLNGTILVVASINKTVEKNLPRILKNFSRVFTVEAHYIRGGLGSLLAEVITENQLPVRLLRYGLKIPPRGITGSAEYLYKLFGLSKNALVANILKEFSKKNNKG